MLGMARLSSADEETDEGADDEVEERPHRPIVPGGTSANLGFRPPTGVQHLLERAEFLRSL